MKSIAETILQQEKRKDKILVAYNYGNCPCKTYEFIDRYEITICNAHNKLNGQISDVIPKEKPTSKK